MSTDWMTDAEYEEHIRTGALGLRSPTYEELVDRADFERKRAKENRPDAFLCDDPEGQWIADQKEQT